MDRKGPLVGARVVELAHIMAGPVCGKLLADFGADVVKLESLTGDPARTYRPPELGGESAAFMLLNCGKRGIAVDLKHDSGRRIARRLIARADVVIENFRAGTMERLGLDYESLAAENPGLVFCEISGFGRSGPLADRGGFDLIAQGMSGLMSVTGEGPGRPPVKCGVPVTDVTAGVLGALGVLAAWLERERSGRGQRVDTSLFEAGILQTIWPSAIALAGADPPGPLGSAHPLAAPYEAFRAGDGWINVGAASEATWRLLPEVLGMPELLQDTRFVDNASRLAHRAELHALLAEHFAQSPVAVWLERLEQAGIPAGPVLDVREMQSHPQTLARDMVVETTHASAGTMRTLGVPVKFSRTPGAVSRGAPLLGEHTRAVLTEIGLTPQELDRLLAEGIVIQAAMHEG